MSIGAKDHIDKLLVNKYQDTKVDNHDMVASAVPPGKMLEVMQDYAAAHRDMLNLRTRLKTVCHGLNVKAAYAGAR